MHTRTWHLTIHLFEHEGRTRADAVLTTDAGTEIRHEGWARRHPADRDVPEIGDELATCRALAGVAHDLLEAAIADVAVNAPSPGTPHITAESLVRS